MAPEVVYKELLHRKLITAEQYADIMSINRQDPTDFPDALLDKGYIGFEALAQALKQAFLTDFTYLPDEEVDGALVAGMPYQLASLYQMIPLGMEDGVCRIAVANPFRFEALEEAQRVYGCAVRGVFAAPGDIRYHINKHYGRKSMTDIVGQFNEHEDTQRRGTRSSVDLDESPAGRIVRSLIDSAILLNASDIHIEPFGEQLRVRLRIDGRLIEYRNLEPALLQPIVSIIKIMGGMDTFIAMTPQSGHAVYEARPDRLDLRFGTIPTVHGEKTVIRLLYGVRGLYAKERLGFFSDDLERLSLLFKNSHGAVLVTGPTGSGKSTTLYSFLTELNEHDINITTIEDPVENIVFGVNQINVNPKAELGFANILRSVLRQDPDVIMVGEIRDAETAEIAIQAALTGHVVLATLHTNDAVSSILRLIDMGVDRFAVAHSVRGVISQRLVRRICTSCAYERVIDGADARILGIPADMTVFEGRGCAKCNNTGYNGRFAVYEYFVMDARIRELIDEHASFETISDYLLKSGMKTLKDNTLKNVRLGNTTVSEMYRVVF